MRLETVLRVPKHKLAHMFLLALRGTPIFFAREFSEFDFRIDLPESAF